MINFQFKFHWNLFPRVQLTINPRQLTSIGSGNDLASDICHAITWTNDDSVHWRTYVALGGVQLTHFSPAEDDDL